MVSKIFIPCSYGELIDKFTILQIKVSKAYDETQLKNVTLEHDYLKSLVKDLSDPLIGKLREINNSLWELEDNIRLKSKSKSFDQEYVQFAEKIHITNDLRYQVKRAINEKYSSEIRDEKIYEKGPKVPKVPIDNSYLQLFSKGKFQESYDSISRIISKIDSKLLDPKDQAVVELIANYQTCQTYLGKVNTFNDFLHQAYLQRNNFSKEFRDFLTQHYALNLLHRKKYDKIKDVIGYLQKVTGPYGICPETSGFFQPGDSNKLLLVVNSGGLGDILMFSRFIPELCSRYPENKIMYLSSKPLYWIFEETFREIPNLTLCTFDDFDSYMKLRMFDYHCSIIQLIYFLGKSYDNVGENAKYLKDLKSTDDIKLPGETPIIAFNWKGSTENMCEMTNRRISLQELSKVFSSKYTFVSVQPTLDPKEKKILNSHKVIYFDDLDKNTSTFSQTISILRRCKYLISSDTSILHLAGSMGIPSIGLIVKGPDWRWERNGLGGTNWYPEMKIFRQNVPGKWDNVISDLLKI